MTLILHNATFVVSQPGDGNDSAPQRLVVTVETCGAEPYLVIKTERWAVDSLEEWEDVLSPLYQAAIPLFPYFEQWEPPGPCPSRS